MQASVRASDVAALAGVSVSTVSRALAQPQQVAPATRQRVVAAAASLGYRPNPAARSLITGRTGNVGVVVPDLENPFFASVAKGAQSRARTAGLATFVADSEEDVRQEVELVRSLARQVDGILLCSPRAPDTVLAELAAGRHLVLVNRRSGDIPAVSVDNRGGMQQAVAHLHALGHRRIAWAGGPARSWSNAERLAALRDCVEQHPGTELVELGGFGPFTSGGYAAGDLVLAQRATAVVAFNDMVGLGLLDRFRARGVRVPEDVSVVGVDNVVVAALTSPSLTSVELSLVQSGRAGVDLLLGLVEGGTTPPPPPLDAHLVVRGSTGPPPG